jgi:hypothetical protein
VSKHVFANGRGVSAKADDNKSVCAMPDVCMSPPSPPAGPVPIPYPNTSTASKTSDGSKTVKIGGDEVGLKDKSNYKDSNGDEAATKSFGMGVVSHNIQGKMQHAAWSFDVKIEGQNAIRHMDMTTHNHGSNTNGALTLDAEEMATDGASTSCEELDGLNESLRGGDVRPGFKKGITVTTAKYGDDYMWGATPEGALRSAAQGYEPVNTKTTMACADSEFPGNSSVDKFKYANHTEPKMIESILQQSGGPPSDTLIMKIHWTSVRKKKKSTRNDPCNESCKAYICAAVWFCGLKIKLCNDKNKEVEPQCKNGKPAPEAQWQAAGLGTTG